MWRTDADLVRSIICTIVFCSILCEPAGADDAADKLLANYAARAKSQRTLSARISLSWQTPGQSVKRNAGSVILMKPNYAVIRLTGDYPLITLASDGRSRYLLSDPTKYTIANADPHGKNIDTPWWALPVRFFFTQSIKPFGPDSPHWTSGRYAGMETIGNQSYNVIEIRGDKPMAYLARFYFDGRKVLRRSVVQFGEGEGAAVFTAEMEEVRSNRRLRLRPKLFKFRPPDTAKLDTGAESRMLALGETAPDFSLPTAEGKMLTLATLRQEKKATLVNFWYLACPPCREEFQLFQKLYTDLKDRGFTIVAINSVDDAAEVRTYTRRNDITFPIVIGERDVPGVLGSYRIETYPSTYLLNSEGKIVYKSVGVDEAGLLRALKELGLRK